MHRAKASKSCQLFGVPYLFHALCFFALRVESTGALEGVARFGFDAGLTLHILGRLSLALSFLTDHRHTGMLTFLVVGHRSGVAGGGALHGPAPAVEVPRAKEAHVTRTMLDALMIASSRKCGSTNPLC
jgi:hypothetical protein